MASKPSEFRAIMSEGEEIILPYSKLTVKIRPISITGLVRRGIVPQELLSEALRGFPELKKLESSSKAKDEVRLADMLIQFEQYTFAVLSEMLVDPRLTDDPNDLEAITLAHMLEEDKATLLNLAQMPISNWRTFLQEQRESLQPVDNGEQSEDPTE